MTSRCPKIGRWGACLLVLSGCGSATATAAVTSGPPVADRADARPAQTIAATEPVHPLEEARRALLVTSTDTPHYAEVLSEVRARLEALSFSSAPAPTRAMTCALASAARPILSLHAAGVINWNSSRFDDMEITDGLVSDWCADLADTAQADCSVADDSADWLDRCGECEEDDGPSLEDRRRALAHGHAACEAWQHLHDRCTAGAVLDRVDALAFAESCRYDAEASFESASCWVNTADTDPIENLGLAIERLEHMAAPP